MRVIRSEPITILSTNVPETEALYAAATTYAQGAVVRYNHRVYKSIVANNKGNQPDISPASWSDQGATNAYRCIDEYVNTVTAHPSIEMTVQVGRASAIVFFGLAGTNLHITMRHGIEGVLLDEDILLRQWGVSGGQSCQSWSEYFFGELVQRRRHFLLLPYAISGVELDISITDSSGLMCECGNIVIGPLLHLGATQFGLNLELNDYSKKTVDEFGRVYLKQGTHSSTADVDVYIRASDLDGAVNAMTELRGSAHCWILENTDTPMHESTIMFGFWDSFRPVLSGPSGYNYNLIIKGMI